MKKTLITTGLIATLGFAAFIFTEANHTNTGYIISVSDEDI